MAAITHEAEQPSSIPAAKLFKVYVLEGDTLLPKILPQVIKSVEILEGNGGPGTIKNTTFADGSEFKYVKNRVDAIDKDNFTYAYTSFEGEPWNDALDKISYELKFVASPDGGSINKSVIKYYTKGDGKLDEEQIKAGEEKLAGIVKVVEAYILANPDV